mmetsp:Transcript_2304/g.6689  ORF Transcript_2304/g.6689 Transcript_2304/m.6689 type:complete len:291 (-) Transcript_2304:154-1026(-)
MYGSASGGHGRMHACTVSGVPPSRLDIVEKESVAALTRAGSACTWPGGYFPARSSSASTYSDPPMPHKYTSPLLRGYTSRCVPNRLSSPQKRAKGSTSRLASLKTIEVDLMPVIGTGMSNQSCARAAHGPIVQANARHATRSPSITTADTDIDASPPLFSMPSTAPMRSEAPAESAASTSLVQSSCGATCAPPSRSIQRESAISPSSHGQMSVVLFERTQGVTDRTGILRYEVMPRDSASSWCSAKEVVCSCSVGPLPQSRARKPPPLPLAAAATECLSTSRGFSPRCVR